MKRFIVLALLVLMLTMVFAIPASASTPGPCGESNHTGRDYAEQHIVPLGGEDGLLGQGHKPGTHQGYSTCL